MPLLISSLPGLVSDMPPWYLHMSTLEFTLLAGNSAAPQLRWTRRRLTDVDDCLPRQVQTSSRRPWRRGRGGLWSLSALPVCACQPYSMSCLKLTINATTKPCGSQTGWKHPPLPQKMPKNGRLNRSTSHGESHKLLEHDGNLRCHLLLRLLLLPTNS